MLWLVFLRVAMGPPGLLPQHRPMLDPVGRNPTPKSRPSPKRLPKAAPPKVLMTMTTDASEPDDDNDAMDGSDASDGDENMSEAAKKTKATPLVRTKGSGKAKGPRKDTLDVATGWPHPRRAMCHVGGSKLR